MTLQTIINRVLIGNSVQDALVGDAAGEMTALDIDAREIRRVLKGRKQAGSEGEFRGFGSPPGRF